MPVIHISNPFENYIEGPPKSGGIHTRFSRDEEPEAWYTTTLITGKSSSKLSQIRHSHMQSDATIFLAILHRHISTFPRLAAFSIFQPFNHGRPISTFRSIFELAIARHLLCLIQSTDITIHKWFTSSLLLTSLSPNPDFQRGKLGILELRTCKSPVAHSRHGLHSFLLADCMQIYNAQCDVSRMGNEGIAFLRDLWALVMELSHVLVLHPTTK